jgi:hypothetical protein
VLASLSLCGHNTYSCRFLLNVWHENKTLWLGRRVVTVPASWSEDAWIESGLAWYLAQIWDPFTPYVIDSTMSKRSLSRFYHTSHSVTKNLISRLKSQEQWHSFEFIPRIIFLLFHHKNHLFPSKLRYVQVWSRTLLMLIGGDLEDMILSQPTGNFLRVHVNRGLLC